MYNHALPSILALNVAGDPVRWIDYEKAAFYYAKDRVAWELGDDFWIYGGTRAETRERSKMNLKVIIAVRGMTKNKATLFGTPRLTNRALFARDGQICAYCAQPFSLIHLTRDHVHPLSKGGKDVWENVVTACKRCNNLKADRDVNETNMRLVYVPYAPDRAEHLILSNRRIIADQMEYLKKFVSNKNSRVFTDDRLNPGWGGCSHFWREDGTKDRCTKCGESRDAREA